METLDFKAEKELKIYTHTLYMQLGYELIWNRRKNGVRERGGAKWVVSHVLLDWMEGKRETKQRYEKYTDI